MAEAKKKKGRPPGHPSGKTQEELAAAEGVSVATWQRWQKNKLLDGAELVKAKREAEIKRVDTVRYKDAMYLAVANGQVFPKEDLMSAMAQIASVEDQKDVALISELPNRVEGLNAPETKKECQAFVDEWKERRKNSHAEVWKIAEEASVKLVKGDLKKVVASKAREQ
mgnify:FL=1